MKVMGRQIYRFDGVEVDPSQGVLRRNGKELEVRQKSLQVLVYLLEQRHRLVTKEELIERVWEGMAVTDDALVQLIKEIRRSLGDDPRRPRFIKTVPKVGYRFIAAVEDIFFELPVATLEIERQASVQIEFEEEIIDVPWKAGETEGRQQLLTHPVTAFPSRRVILAFVVTITLLVVGTLAAYLAKRPRPSSEQLAAMTLPQLPGKKTLAVMYFENQSQSADLDWLREGLADMLITDLSRSKNLAVLSRQQLQLLLERTGHSGRDSIRLDEALDIARKSQAGIVILGSFARLGEQIRIEVQLHDARDGQLLAAERLVVEQPAQILTQIDLLCLKLASRLGAPPAEQEATTGLTTGMTNNLEAYRDYSLAVEKAQALHSEEAIALLQKAVALDPLFAMAYARIGYTYTVSWGRVDEGKPYLEKAFQLSGRLTEKDKLNIAAWYAIANRDYPEAIKSFQEIVARYPLEVEAYQRLGDLLRGEDRSEEAIEVIKLGLTMDSGAKELYNELGGAYMELGRHDEAIAMFQRYVELAPQEPNAHDSLGSGYQWAGRYQDGIEEYSRALVLKPDFEIAVIHLGNSYFQQGRYRDAIQQYQRYHNLASADSERARSYCSIAAAQRMSGKLEDAERTAKLAAKLEKWGVSQLLLLALQKGDLKNAAKFQELLEDYFFRGPHFNSRGARISLREPLFYQANLDLKSGRVSEAITTFKAALKHRPPIWNHDSFEDCLANAYLVLGRWDEAIAEYERILHLNPNYPLLHYHLAQAYERKGQPDQARASYERFLEVWKDADPEVPEVVSARKMVSVGQHSSSNIPAIAVAGPKKTPKM